MKPPQTPSRSPEPKTHRAQFGTLVHGRFQARVRETIACTTLLVVAPNIGWARWQLEDGRYVYLCIRRRMDFLTGELGVSLQPLTVEELHPIQTLDALPARGACRIQLGFLLEGREKWWSSGGSEKTLIERMDWLTLQLQARLHDFLRRSVRAAA